MTEPTRMRPRADAKEVFVAINEHLDGRRFTERSADDAVSATVDGGGALRELSITETVLRGPFPQQAGASIVAAVRAARRSAAETRDRLTERFFDPTVPDPELGGGPPHPAERPRRARTAPDPADQVDDFEQIDFVRPGRGSSGTGRR